MRRKLVRDRIPEIIQQAGLVPVIETASPQDYARYVRAKLQEELEEYLSSGDVTEVADLIEVCFAAAALHGVDQDELLAIARDKRQQRGGFDNRLIWLGTCPALTNRQPDLEKPGRRYAAAGSPHDRSPPDPSSPRHRIALSRFTV